MSGTKPHVYESNQHYMKQCRMRRTRHRIGSGFSVRIYEAQRAVSRILIDCLALSFFCKRSNGIKVKSTCEVSRMGSAISVYMALSKPTEQLNAFAKSDWASQEMLI